MSDKTDLESNAHHTGRLLPEPILDGYFLHSRFSPRFESVTATFVDLGDG